MTHIALTRPTTGDIVALILADHRLMEDYLRELRKASNDRAQLRVELCDLVIAHGEAEENIAYPKLTRKGAISEHDAEHGEEEHAELNEAILGLWQAKGTDTTKFEDALEKVVEKLHHHLNEEELTILNSAFEDLSKQARVALGEQWCAARNKGLDEHIGREESVAAIVARAHKDGLLPAEDEESEQK